ncbi:MAG: colanic acid biosynthesis glycosyltransferase WcaL [Acidocella sp. 20-57-95]|nr:MAG: colanic acid biosynthesis glycosyltransferase WcaL [Acidocella sp. 20-57-95]OYV59879.1 MAG: colanic acid biosynthesis glycosyltransferase WcaL [Acidocella sp. 21-58-7]HQT63822.1 glycosyltransferase [Acidocella sp.]HQU03893.1 glycosyltransferase [Acidocella sp.]
MNNIIPPGDGPVAYVMKRYPRLSETFIVNEIRAMERLGADIRIFSLLPPEPPPHHPMTAQVSAPVAYLPAEGFKKWQRMLNAHAACLGAAPWRYIKAFSRAVQWSIGSASPPAVWKQFGRAGIIAAACRFQGIRHIHGHFANAPTAVTQFASIMTGLPFSFTAHAKDLYLTPRNVIARRGAAANFIATCTGYNVQYLSEVLAPEHAAKIHLVYHGIDLDMFHNAPSALPTPRQGKLILSVGRLVPKKGHDTLISACGILRDKGVAFKCMIVGGGPLRDELAAQIAALGLHEHVSLEGAMTQARLIELYRRADLFALAPLITEDGDRDGIPNVIVEAMATNVPVVSTAISGIPEIIHDGVTGLLVPPREPVILSEAMARLLADPDFGQVMAKAARARLESEFDLWRTTSRLHRLMGCVECAPQPSESRFTATAMMADA